MDECVVGCVCAPGGGGLMFAWGVILDQTRWYLCCCDNQQPRSRSVQYSMHG